MKQNLHLFGKVLYSLIFLIIVPLGLLFWAKFTDDIITLSVIQSKTAGFVLIFTGIILMAWGMFSLWFFGKGLPMNAYPPPLFVREGPYRFFRHPIYWGFGITIFGYFLAIGSSSGIWMVTPVTILGMVALVLGYESITLKQRFPSESIRTILDYPENDNNSTSFRDKITSIFWVGLFLMISNFMLYKLHGNVLPLVEGPTFNMPFPTNFNVSILSGAFIVISVLFIRKKKRCRSWEITGFIALGWSSFLAFLFPEIGAQYSSANFSVLSNIPLFLVFISVWSIYQTSKKMAIYFILPAIFISLVQLGYSKSPVLELGVSIAIFFLSVYYLKIWLFLKNTSEKIANSWHEWVFGKIRIINHGIYVGLGAFGGILLAGFLAGRTYALGLLVFTIIVTVTSALWAQIIEGSAKLKRPFGYYGGLVGIIFGSVAIWLMNLNIWVVIGVTSVVMPWVQAMGRLRCLVNGCCHGSKIDNPMIGIRYFHHRSRVTNISHLKGEMLHPTQLYSILWLFFIGFFLLALWINSAPFSLIFGLYLILTGIGRFVEEAYRGEAQTPNVKGLHLYQWTAIISVVAGIIMTLFKVSRIQLDPGFNWESVWVALICGLFVFFAMGVDFPYSNARFSRLV